MRIISFRSIKPPTRMLNMRLVLESLHKPLSKPLLARCNQATYLALDLVAVSSQ